MRTLLHLLLALWFASPAALADVQSDDAQPVRMQEWAGDGARSHVGQGPVDAPPPELETVEPDEEEDDDEAGGFEGVAASSVLPSGIGLRPDRRRHAPALATSRSARAPPSS